MTLKASGSSDKKPETVNPTVGEKRKFYTVQVKKAKAAPPKVSLQPQATAKAKRFKIASTGDLISDSESDDIDGQLALLKFSIEAGILLCGNGVSRHVGCTHARTHARSLTVSQVILILSPSCPPSTPSLLPPSLPAIRSTLTLNCLL